MQKNYAMKVVFMLGLAALLPLAGLAMGDDDTKQTPPDSRIKVTLQIPETVETFQGGAVVATLYEFDPFLADAPAMEVDNIVIRHLGHQQGVEQTLRFNLGDALGTPRDKRRYYIGCRVYEDLGDDTFERGKQLYHGYNDHDRLPGMVYDKVNARSITFTLKP